MKKSLLKQMEIEKNNKSEVYELNINEMFKIRGGDDMPSDPGKLK